MLGLLQGTAPTLFTLFAQPGVEPFPAREHAPVTLKAFPDVPLPHLSRHLSRVRNLHALASPGCSLGRDDALTLQIAWHVRVR